ncbi:trithorax group protein osa-like [Microtus oregoni]|uniref:trithorax group protein osa-like n=1 Tax=Microtus oregoni TaxID=111838 RepID=UPI001BB24295|nr:trithorax group protein osa-like [Microtus oregoni]
MANALNMAIEKSAEGCQQREGLSILTQKPILRSLLRHLTAARLGPGLLRLNSPCRQGSRPASAAAASCVPPPWPRPGRATGAVTAVLVAAGSLSLVSVAAAAAAAAAAATAAAAAAATAAAAAAATARAFAAAFRASIIILQLEDINGDIGEEWDKRRRRSWQEEEKSGSR